jgi:hypothetical protein
MTTANINEIILSRAGSMMKEYDNFKEMAWELKSKVTRFADDHKIIVGSAEIAAGIAAIYGGVAIGGLLESSTRIPEFLGVIGGGGLGGSLGYLLGGIGIVAGGGAIGIPALVVAGIGGTIGATMGFSVGSLINEVFGSNFTVFDQLGGGALIAAGLWMIFDGVRRILKSGIFSDIIKKIREVIQSIIVKTTIIS